jgi:serine phosphatase RsbU (regulator of sigma subunit)
MVDDAAGVLAFLNAELRRHAGPPAFCTVGCALIAPAAGGGFDVRLSSGGHPFPLLVRADGSLEPVEVHGTMLGVADDPQLERVTRHLAPGDALVVYTDGVVDARQAGGERFGERRLHDALRRAAGGSAEVLARAVETAVRAHHPASSADDRAIVVVRAAD